MCRICLDRPHHPGALLASPDDGEGSDAVLAFAVYVHAIGVEACDCICICAHGAKLEVHRRVEAHTR